MLNNFNYCFPSSYQYILSFRELRGLLHVSHVHIDSWVFRLHYSVTTTCMFAFSLIVSAKQYVGNPIDCIHTKDIPEVSTVVMARLERGVRDQTVQIYFYLAVIVQTETMSCIYQSRKLQCVTIAVT